MRKPQDVDRLAHNVAKGLFTEAADIRTLVRRGPDALSEVEVYEMLAEAFQRRIIGLCPPRLGEIEEALRHAFGCLQIRGRDSVIVVPTANHESVDLLGYAAAQNLVSAVYELGEEEHRLPVGIAISGGESLQGVVSAIPLVRSRRLDNLWCYALTSAPTHDWQDILRHPNILTARLAEAVGSEHACPLEAPAYFDDPEEAAAFLARDDIKQYCELVRQSRLVLVAVGNTSGDRDPLRGMVGQLGDEDAQKVLHRSVGSIAYNLFGPEGEILEGHMGVATLMGHTDLQEMAVSSDKRVVSVVGEGKATALFGALRGAYFDTLICCESTAREVLDRVPPEDRNGSEKSPAADYRPFVAAYLLLVKGMRIEGLAQELSVPEDEVYGLLRRACESGVITVSEPASFGLAQGLTLTSSVEVERQRRPVIVEAGEDPNELARAAAAELVSIMQEVSRENPDRTLTIALSGGRTLREVVDAVPEFWDEEVAAEVGEIECLAFTSALPAQFRDISCHPSILLAKLADVVGAKIAAPFQAPPYFLSSDEATEFLKRTDMLAQKEMAKRANIILLGIGSMRDPESGTRCLLESIVTQVDSEAAQSEPSGLEPEGESERVSQARDVLEKAVGDIAHHPFGVDGLPTGAPHFGVVSLLDLDELRELALSPDCRVMGIASHGKGIALRGALAGGYMDTVVCDAGTARSALG